MALSKPPPSKSPSKPPVADPLAQFNPKALGLRVGIPLVIVWVIAVVVGRPWAFIAAGGITAVVAGGIVWLLRFAKKNRDVAALVQGADTAEGRRQAIAKLETDYKKGDTAAIFAKAQLLLQEDPKKALETLETIDLNKVMAPMADEARAQRAMIHLVLGETDRARVLVDGIELSRHQQAKSRAMIATVVAEAWARTGQARKAIDTLGIYDPEDADLVDLKPQMYRALAFAQAGINDAKGIRRSVHKLAEVNPQLLAGFLGKKVHPLLQKEAKEALQRSGAVPRKMIVKRM